MNKQLILIVSIVRLLFSGSDDTQVRQSEVSKMNVVYKFAKTIPDSVVFSRPLPNLTSDDIKRFSVMPEPPTIHH